MDHSRDSPGSWHRSAALLVGGACLLALVLFADLPPWPRIFSVLNNAAHAPVFGALSVIVLLLVARGSSSITVGQLLTAFLCTVIIGVGVELAQAQMGRDAAWADIWRDGLGAAFALAITYLWKSTRHTVGYGTRGILASGAVAVASLVLILHPVGQAAYAYWDRSSRFPVIAQFEGLADLYFSAIHHATGSIEPLPGEFSRPGDSSSLRLDLGQGNWPGIALTEPEPDWRDMKTLVLDVTNPGLSRLPLTIRVHDRTHDQQYEDRFNRSLELLPATRQQLRIPLEDIRQGPRARELDLSQVAGVILFASGPIEEGSRLYVTRIWLE